MPEQRELDDRGSRKHKLNLHQDPDAEKKQSPLHQSRGLDAAGKGPVPRRPKYLSPNPQRDSITSATSSAHAPVDVRAIAEQRRRLRKDREEGRVPDEDNIGAEGAMR